MKKIVACCLLLLLLLLPACGTSSQPGDANGAATGQTTDLLDPQNPVTLTLWHYYVGENQQALDAAVDQFNQTVGIENGVIVEALNKGSIAELEEAVSASAMGIINADPMPDIFSSYPDKALEIDGLEMLCDLNDYFTEEEKQLYVQDFLEDGIFDGGRFLLVPIVKSTELTYINATHWDEFAGSEGYTGDDMATWEGMLETARAYYEWTNLQTDEAWGGKSLMGFDSVANYIIIASKQLGLDVIDGNTQQAVLDADVLRPIFENYYVGYSLGYYDAVGKFRSDDIKAGDLVGYVGSSSSAAYFPTWIEDGNTQQDIEFLALAYPYFEDGTPYAVQQGAGMCVAKSTPQQEAGAALFLKWFTDAEQNIEFAMTTGYLPVQNAAYESASFEGVLQDLRAGEQAEQNVAAVYEIALNQITISNTYSAKPFEGSYDVRSTLQATLMDLGDEGRTVADEMKESALSEAEILEALDVDARFEEWLENIRSSLDILEIAYQG